MNNYCDNGPSGSDRDNRVLVTELVPPDPVVEKLYIRIQCDLEREWCVIRAPFTYNSIIEAGKFFKFYLIIYLKILHYMCESRKFYSQEYFVNVKTSQKYKFLAEINFWFPQK